MVLLPKWGSFLQTQPIARGRVRGNATEKRGRVDRREGCLNRTGLAGVLFVANGQERHAKVSKARFCVRGGAGRIRTLAADLRGIPRCYAAGDRRLLLASLCCRRSCWGTRRSCGAIAQLIAPHPPLGPVGLTARRITNMVRSVKVGSGAAGDCVAVKMCYTVSHEKCHHRAG